MKKILFFTLFLIAIYTQSYQNLFTSSFIQEDNKSYESQGWTGFYAPSFICGKYVQPLTVQNSFIQKTISSIPTHTKLKISYNGICSQRITNPEQDSILNLKIDGELIETISVQNPSLQPYGTCTTSTIPEELTPYSTFNSVIEITHQVPSISLKLTKSASSTQSICLLENINIEYLPEIKDNYECKQRLNSLKIDGENLDISVDISNSTHDIYQFKGQIMHKFEMEYSNCLAALDRSVFFNGNQLRKGDGELNNWNFENSDFSSIVWNIRREDLNNVYNCQKIVNENDDGEYLSEITMCTFSINMSLQGDVLMEKAFQFQIQTDGNGYKMDYHSRVVEGECCESQLNIETQLRFCETMECNSYIETDPVIYERAQDIFVEHRVLTDFFQTYYVNFLQAELNEYIPDIIKYDSSQPGRVLIQLRANLVKNDQTLKIVSQIQKNPVTPSIGPSETRILQSNQDQQTNFQNGSNLIGLRQISIINIKKPDIILNNQQQQFKVNFLEKNEKNDQKQNIFEQYEIFLVITLVGILVLLVFIYLMQVLLNLKRENKRLKKKEGEIVNFQNVKSVDTQDSEQQNQQ